jgi:hypothetical protein
MMRDKSSADRGGTTAPLAGGASAPSAEPAGSASGAEKEDPMKGLLDSMKKDEAGKKP